MPTEMSIREMYELIHEGTHMEIDQVEYVQLQGWIRTNRSGKNVSFIALNDGTYYQNAQIVYSSDVLSNYEEVSHYLTGTAVGVVGKFIATPGAKQPFDFVYNNDIPFRDQYKPETKAPVPHRNEELSP